MAIKFLSTVAVDTNVLYVDAAANKVGIGTTNPSTKLEIADTTPTLRLTDTRNLNVGDWDDVSLGKVQFKTSDTSSPGARVLSEIEAYSGVGAASAPESQLRFKTSTNSDTSATTKMTIDAQGNVGIGTTSPSRKLEVYSSSSSMVSQFRSGSGTNSFICFSNTASTVDQVRIGSVSSNLVLSTNYTEKMRITSAGNVGIGVTTPRAKLDVAGGVKVADDTDTAGANKVGTLRYRTSGNNSYVDMCMQTGASTYAWINVVQNNW